MKEELYNEAKALIIESQRASVSYLQRELKINYAIAAEVMGKLEERGVVTPPNYAGKRTIIEPKT